MHNFNTKKVANFYLTLTNIYIVLTKLFLYDILVIAVRKYAKTSKKKEQKQYISYYALRKIITLVIIRLSMKTLHRETILLRD